MSGLDSRSGELPSVGVVGGGLAGLAAAVALAEHGCRVELFEAKRQLGGRAGSFFDPATGATIDHCQHVGMACCTNLIDFCERIGAARRFDVHRRLYFFGPDGRRYDFQATPGLPAPLHLAPAMMRLGFLTRRQRIGVARALMALARTPAGAAAPQQTIGDWLRQRGQSQAAIDRFWSVVLVSALSETVDRASVAAARKVFVDGFMGSPEAYFVHVPNAPLETIYGQRLIEHLRRHGARVRLATAVEQAAPCDEGMAVCAGNRRHTFDRVILATTWRRVGQVLAPELARQTVDLTQLTRIESAPITAVHLWFDRAVTTLPHAILIDRLSQWVFDRGIQHLEGFGGDLHYVQVVISASRNVPGRPHQTVVEEVRRDLAAIFPQARQARLRHYRVVTQREAVFSATPEFESLRPGQATAHPRLFLAGDWTDTGWPSTMEGAVRSGYLAAEELLRADSRPARFLVKDLPRSWLARRLFGKA